jgi:hypothetical protein
VSSIHSSRPLSQHLLCNTLNNEIAQVKKKNKINSLLNSISLYINIHLGLPISPQLSSLFSGKRKGVMSLHNHLILADARRILSDFPYYVL